ncbi:hypothetical protein HOY82DRAFT_601649 [Tuber indicum]|nr:hypothetical protein HOY82DRAFT_601649 [Tuber indicum]
MAGSGNANATDIDDLRRQGEDLVASMTFLRYAAEEVSRADLALFNSLIGFKEGQKQPPQALLQSGNVKVDLGPKATRNGIKAELAKRWSDTAEDQKKAWENIASKDREVYEKGKATYKASKALQTAESSIGFTPVDFELQNVQESEAESDKAELIGRNEEDEDVEGSEKAFATNGNGNLKAALNPISISGTSTAATPVVVDLRAVAESAMRKRTGCKRVMEAEEEEAPDEASSKNKAIDKRRKHSA